MRARPFLFSVLTLLLALPLGVSAQAGGEGQVSLAIGTVGPGAAVEDLEGNDVDLIDFVRGKPAVLEFWATWCELCEALQPQLDQIQAMHGDDVNVVAVAVGVAQTVRRVRRHLVLAPDANPSFAIGLCTHGFTFQLLL